MKSKWYVESNLTLAGLGGAMMERIAAWTRPIDFAEFLSPLPLSSIWPSNLTSHTVIAKIRNVSFYLITKILRVFSSAEKYGRTNSHQDTKLR